MATNSGAKNATTQPAPEAERGWGKEKYPYPQGAGYIECDELKCVGCGVCQMACSMMHFQVINKDLARIQVRKYLLPLPKAIQTTCVQCQAEERQCEKACPVDPPAVYFDPKTLHMVFDAERCLGERCLLCKKACSSSAIGIYPEMSHTPFVCDLCDIKNQGIRAPQCVNVCPYGALYFKTSAGRFGYSIRDVLRKHPDEKAELIAKRLYPLPKDSMGYPGWRT